MTFRQSRPKRSGPRATGKLEFVKTLLSGEDCYRYTYKNNDGKAFQCELMVDAKGRYQFRVVMTDGLAPVLQEKQLDPDVAIDIAERYQQQFAKEKPALQAERGHEATNGGAAASVTYDDSDFSSKKQQKDTQNQVEVFEYYGKQEVYIYSSKDTKATKVNHDAYFGSYKDNNGALYALYILVDEKGNYRVGTIRREAGDQTSQERNIMYPANQADINPLVMQEIIRCYDEMRRQTGKPALAREIKRCELERDRPSKPIYKLIPVGQDDGISIYAYSCEAIGGCNTEKYRLLVDGEGNYQLQDLRPGLHHSVDESELPAKDFIDIVNLYQSLPGANRPALNKQKNLVGTKVPKLK